MNLRSHYLIAICLSNAFILVLLIYFDCFSTEWPTIRYYHSQIKLFIGSRLSGGLNNNNERIDYCDLPGLLPINPEVDKLIRHPKEVKCTQIQPNVTYLDNEGSLIINAKELLKFRKRISCWYSYFDRGQSDEAGILYENPVQFDWKHTRNFSMSRPFLNVSCYIDENNKLIYRNVHAYPLLDQNLAPYKNFYSKNYEKLNVILLALESTSLEMMRRHLPLTLQYLTQNMSAINFEKFAKIGENTLPNLVPLFTGLRARMEEKWHRRMPAEIGKTKDGFYDNHPMIWKEYGNKGFITSYLEDLSRIGTFQYSGRGFRQKPTDFWYYPFWRTLETAGMPLKSDRFCFGNVPIHKIFLDIVRKSIVSSAKWHLPHFLFGIFSALSHDFTSDIERMDFDLRDFLAWLNENDSHYLNETLLVLFGDHGPRFSAIRPTFQGFVEERHPALFLKFPDWFYGKYSNLANNLKQNSHILTTAFDLHETLKDILEGQFSELNTDNHESTTMDERGVSLLRPLPKNRNCSTAGVPIYFCLCEHLSQLNISTSLSQELISLFAKYVIRTINGFTKKNRKKCSKFKWDKILYLVEYKSTATRTFVLGLQTWPSAKFEAFLSLDHSADRFSTNMTRIEPIDSYGRRGRCINAIHEAKFCHCVN